MFVLKCFDMRATGAEQAVVHLYKLLCHFKCLHDILYFFLFKEFTKITHSMYFAVHMLRSNVQLHKFLCLSGTVPITLSPQVHFVAYIH